MPEGPEIRNLADRLSDGIAGERAVRVRTGLARLRHLEDELSGLRVESVEPRGKALLTRFEGGRVLYTHNQLYGRWYLCAPDRPPRTNRSLRVAIETPRRWALLFSASEIELLDEDDLREHPFLSKLGPDLLDPRTTPARIRRLLASDRFRRRSLGSLLLDQGFLAGVGNYLRSEILFFAGLPPEARPMDLDAEELGRLSRAARTVTRRAYATKGVTEERVLADRGRAQGLPRREWRHAVFGRAGNSCRRCDSKIRRLEVAGRRLYLCPGCQPTRGSSPPRRARISRSS